MARFRFRLQRVLDVAVQRERLARGDLAQALAGRAAAARRRAEREALLAAGRAELAARLRGGLPAWQWAVHARHLASLAEAVAAAAAEEAAWGERVEAARAALLERRREQRALAVLRARAWARHRQGEARAERRLLDELSVIRWSRSAGG